MLLLVCAIHIGSLVSWSPHNGAGQCLHTLLHCPDQGQILVLVTSTANTGLCLLLLSASQVLLLVLARSVGLGEGSGKRNLASGGPLPEHLHGVPPWQSSFSHDKSIFTPGQ